MNQPSPFAEESPYASPRPIDAGGSGLPYHDPLPASALKRGVLAVIYCGAIFGALGALIGLMMGLVVPNYYYTVFASSAGQLNPPAVGFGLGLTQGIGVGVGVGLVVVIATAWGQRRRRGEGEIGR